MKIVFFVCLALSVIAVAAAALFKWKYMWYAVAALSIGTAVTAFFAFVDFHDHKVVEISRVAPTCEQAGEIVFACNECDEGGYTGVIAKKPHTMSAFEVTKQPTCADGEQTATCTVCGYTVIESVPAVDKHELGEWVEVKPATCANEGLKEARCKHCDHVRQVTLPMKPCTW